MSEEQPVQLTFDGRQVGAAKFFFGGLTFDYLPEGLTWKDVASLKSGDHVEIRMRLVYNLPKGDVKHDSDNGTEVGPVAQHFRFDAYREDFAITQILSRADREKAWRESQGASA